MRSLMFLLVMLLFCSVWETSSATSAIDKPHSVCCEGFNDANIPLKKIKSYQNTTIDCPINAIVFITFSRKEICVDPEKPLVIKQVAVLDSRTKK